MVVAFGFAGVIPRSIMHALPSLGQREDSLAVQVLRCTIVSLPASTLRSLLAILRRWTLGRRERARVKLEIHHMCLDEGGQRCTKETSAVSSPPVRRRRSYNSLNVTAHDYPLPASSILITIILAAER